MGTIYDKLTDKIGEKLANKLSDEILDRLDLDELAEIISDKILEQERNIGRLVENFSEEIVDRLVGEFEYSVEEHFNMDPDDFLQKPYLGHY